MIVFEGTDQGDVVKRLAPGRYEVRREFACLGETFSRSIRCNSPAYAIGKLDEWEARTRRSLISKLEDRIRKP